MVTRRRAFTLFRDGCVTLDIAASSTPTWRILHQIPSTGELDIELSQKLSAIALTDVRAERVAAKSISAASTAPLPVPNNRRFARDSARMPYVTSRFFASPSVTDARCLVRGSASPDHQPRQQRRFRRRLLSGLLQSRTELPVRDVPTAAPTLKPARTSSQGVGYIAKLDHL
jgi:hypothetical protein